MIVEISPTPRRARIKLALIQEWHRLFVTGLDAVTALPHRYHRRFANGFLSDIEHAPGTFESTVKSPDKYRGVIHSSDNANRTFRTAGGL